MKTRNAIKSLLAAGALLPLAGGCGAVYDDAECTDSANVFEFRYDRNLKYADAFGAEVRQVTLLGFDKSGILVYARTAKQSDLEGGNSLGVRLTPGEYDFLTWAGVYGTDYDIPQPVVGKSRMSDFTCLLKPSAASRTGEGIESSRRLENLYHSLDHVSLGLASPEVPDRQVVDLTKDTNYVQVILQEQGPESGLDPKDYAFEISDDNGALDFDNTLMRGTGRSEVTYTPWAVTTGSASFGDPAEGGGYQEGTKLNMVMAEFSVNRLTPANRAVLTVRRKADGRVIFTFPLIDYALMLKGEYLADMSAADFLDRQDSYSMTFLLDRDERWVSVTIQINDWRIIRHNTALE